MSLNTLQSMNYNIDNRVIEGTASSLKKAIPILSPTNHIITIDPNVGSMFDVYDGGETAFEIRFAQLNGKYTMTGADISVSLHLTDPKNTVITWPNNIVWESDNAPTLKANNMFKFSTYFNTDSSTWNCTYNKGIYISKYNANDFTTRIARVVNGSNIIDTVVITPGINNYTNGSGQQITEFGYATWGLGQMSRSCMSLYQLTIDNNSKLLTFVCLPGDFSYINNGVTKSFNTDVIKAVVASNEWNTEYILEYTETRTVNGQTHNVYTAETESLEIYNYMAAAYSNQGAVGFAFYADPNRME